MFRSRTFRSFSHFIFLGVLCTTQISAISDQAIRLSEYSVGQTAGRVVETDEVSGRDIILIMDTSASMAYATSGGSQSSDPGDDPSVCNLANTCQPMASIKSAAIDFLDQLSFPFDRV